MHKGLTLLAVAALILACSSQEQPQPQPKAQPTQAQPQATQAQPQATKAQPEEAKPMEKDVLASLSKGYDLFRDGKHEAAEAQFKEALKKGYNPFALNNLAALMERRGKVQQAMIYLTLAQTHAEEYHEGLEQSVFPGGDTAAVKPIKGPASDLTLARVVADNLAKIKEKLPKRPPPAMMPQPLTAPPTKEAPKK